MPNSILQNRRIRSSQKAFWQTSNHRYSLKEFNRPIPHWIEIVQPKSDVDKGLSGYLDAGEATSIPLALENEESLLIIDEIKGSKAAKEMGSR